MKANPPQNQILVPIRQWICSSSELIYPCFFSTEKCNHTAVFCIFKVLSCIYNLNIPYIALRIEMNLAILSKVSVIDTIKLPRTRVSPQRNRLSTCLNSKFLFNYISTPFYKKGSLKYEPAMCRVFLIHFLFTGAFEFVCCHPESAKFVHTRHAHLQRAVH